MTRLELKGNVIRYGDKGLRLEDRIEKWTQVLGPPSKTRAEHYGWFGNTVEVSVFQAVDGREYVGLVTVKLGENGYSDGFVLQGVVLNKGGPPLLDVMDALSGTETELWGLGARGWHTAYMKVASPDGFVVSAYGDLMCVPPPPPSKGKCTKVIDKLSIEAEWHW